MSEDPPKNFTLAEMWRRHRDLEKRVDEIEDKTIPRVHERIDKELGRRRWTRQEVMQMLAVVAAAVAILVSLWGKVGR